MIWMTGMRPLSSKHERHGFGAIVMVCVEDEGVACPTDARNHGCVSQRRGLCARHHGDARQGEDPRPGRRRGRLPLRGRSSSAARTERRCRDGRKASVGMRWSPCARSGAKAEPVRSESSAHRGRAFPGGAGSSSSWTCPRRPHLDVTRHLGVSARHKGSSPNPAALRLRAHD